MEDQLEPRAPEGVAGVEAGGAEAQAGPGAGENSPLALWASVTSFGLCFLTAVLEPSVPPSPAPLSATASQLQPILGAVGNSQRLTLPGT